MKLLHLLIAGLVFLGSAACAKPSFSEDKSQGTRWGDTFPGQAATEEVKKDVPYVPTSYETVELMLRMAQVDKNDLVYDLGSGDGRIVIAAARDFGARGVGIDIDPERIAEAKENAKSAEVTNRVRFIQGDLFTTDLRDATAVTLYLLPSVNLKLRPKLLSDLRPGTPVVSHDFDMGEWEADQTAHHDGDDLFLWIIPADVKGTWTWTESDGAERSANIDQKFQKISGTMGEGEIGNATLRGDSISFEAGGRRYSGRVVANEIIGTSEPAGGGRKISWMARRA